MNVYHTTIHEYCRINDENMLALIIELASEPLRLIIPVPPLFFSLEFLILTLDSDSIRIIVFIENKTDI